jgi:hypothetical protein
MYFLPPGWWIPFSDDDPAGQFFMSFDSPTTFVGVILSATGGFGRGGWDPTTGNFFFTRDRGGSTRIYVGTVTPLLPWPQTGPYTLYGNFFDGPATGGSWTAQTYVVA